MYKSGLKSKCIIVTEILYKFWDVAAVSISLIAVSKCKLPGLGCKDRDDH